MLIQSKYPKDEPFEVRKIAFRYRFSSEENSYDVEVYYPQRFHSVCYQVIGQDEAAVLARLYRNRYFKGDNNVICSEDRDVDAPTT